MAFANLNNLSHLSCRIQYNDMITNQSGAMIQWEPKKFNYCPEQPEHKRNISKKITRFKMCLFFFLI